MFVMRQECNGYIELVNHILEKTKHTRETLAEILSIPKAKLVSESFFTPEEEERLLILSKWLNK